MQSVQEIQVTFTVETYRVYHESVRGVQPLLEGICNVNLTFFLTICEFTYKSIHLAFTAILKVPNIAVNCTMLKYMLMIPGPTNPMIILNRRKRLLDDQFI